MITKDQEKLLEGMMKTLDELISCQREEQDYILKRDTQHLPIITERINHLVFSLEKSQNQALALWPKFKLPDEKADYEREFKTKLNQLQEITMQNHLLLENSLKFLQDLFQAVMGTKDKQKNVYNQFGMMNASLSESGSVFNADF